MSPSPLQPPVPFSDFEFAFDPSLSNLFPNPPPLPSSADLFSPSETTDLLGFLDNFGDLGWDVNGSLNNEPYHQQQPYEHIPPPTAPYSNPHLNSAPDQSTSTRTRSASRRDSLHSAAAAAPPPPFSASRPHSTTSESSSATTPTCSAPGGSTSTAGDTPAPPRSAAGGSTSSSTPRNAKPLLSTPQKRLNHIMSEQKRRNAIRDGYAQLIALMAPAGSAPGIGMPTRGRPKGSGGRGKGQGKGKSGVLFRAVEYCRWLEEGRDSLHDEVIRVEMAAGLRRS